MKDKEALIVECLELREDGKLYWKNRPLEHFKNKNAFSVWNSRFSGKEAGSVTVSDSGYSVRVLTLSGKRYYYHIVKWFLHYGEWPTSIIDHKNQIATDNALSNLQYSDFSENGKNRALGKNSSTGVIGVTFARKGDYFSYVAKGWNPESKKWESLLCTQDFFEAICARKSWELRNGYSENHGKRRKSA